jgi:hypothetical protein
MYVWLVIGLEHPQTPICGVFTSYELADAHCPSGYVIVKLELNFDHVTARAA